MERPKGRGAVVCMSSAEETPPPLWIGAIGTMEIPRLVHQLGGLCLPKYETSTEYNGVIRTRTTQIERAWVSKVGEAPMQQHPWSRKKPEVGGNVPQNPRGMPLASEFLHINIFGVGGGKCLNVTNQ